MYNLFIKGVGVGSSTRSALNISNLLLPTGSEERVVFWAGSIPVAILPSCQDMKTIAFKVYKHKYSWVIKIRNTSEAVLWPQYTLANILTAALRPSYCLLFYYYGPGPDWNADNHFRNDPGKILPRRDDRYTSGRF